MLKPNVFIGGDSWGCGEWPKSGNPEEITHTGLSQYFIEAGYIVTNTSRPDSSNRDSIDRLKQANIQNADYVFWIQSDPLRDLRPYDTLTEEINTAGGLNQLINKLLQRSYFELSQLDSKIYLIGGLFNIRDLSLYNNLIAIIPSWIDLLVGTMPEYGQAKLSNFGISQSDGGIRLIKLHKLNKEIAGQVINEFYYYDKNDQVFREDVFQPDGCHPNRDGHKIAFDQIIKQLEL